MSEVAALDHLTRRVADVLERHLPDYGFSPYCYPSGENKSVHLVDVGHVRISDDANRTWDIRITPTTRVAPVRAELAARDEESQP